jgi:NAD(P)-dependent dehydrogenase (short-subunit alcohol dehydrogenase family)
VLTATPKDYDTLFGVNVKGYGLCAKAAIPHLRKAGKGCIVNVASVNAFIGMPGQSLYNATKAAIVSLTKSMAVDFPELRVNCVAPGFTDTPTIWDTFKAFGFPMEEGYRLLGDGVLMKGGPARRDRPAIVHGLRRGFVCDRQHAAGRRRDRQRGQPGGGNRQRPAAG